MRHLRCRKGQGYEERRIEMSKEEWRDKVVQLIIRIINYMDNNLQ